jgi:NAD(P)-dependent dehydrogenase (short-subunit alcohol dehydrogenase family)
VATFSLAGSRVLVLGGSSGIGFGVACLASELGAHVTIASRNQARLIAARSALPTVEIARVDLMRHPEVSRFFSDNAPFDHVAVTAAELENGPLRGVPLELHRAAMESKFWSAVHAAREARIAPGGSLTFVSGMLSVRPSAQATILTAINAAIEALAKALALELAPVRVNCVSPGRIDTEWWNRLPPDERKALLDRTAERLPLKRIGQPEDIALQIVSCMLNNFMTGTVVGVDGGGGVA